KPTKVFFHVTVMGLDSINEGSMTYAADIFFAQTWKDPRLRLPENMTSEYRLLEVQWLENMWRPDSYFKNAKSVTFQTMTIPNHYVWLYQNKDILYMVKLTLTLSCAMNFATYPHDTQTCSLQMESFTQSLGVITVDIQIEEALANNIYVFIIPNSTQPVDLLVGRPFLDLLPIAHIRIGDELRIGYVKDYLFLNLNSIKTTPCIESKGAETARS
ncbi:glycine receptor subunit alpha-3, partial [Nephila pilipes]